MQRRNRASTQVRRDERHPAEGLVRTYLAGVVAIHVATQSAWVVAIASVVVALAAARVVGPCTDGRRR